MNKIKFTIFQIIFISLCWALLLIDNNILCQCMYTFNYVNHNLIGSPASEGFIFIDPLNSNNAITAETKYLNGGNGDIVVYITSNKGWNWAKTYDTTNSHFVDPSVVIDKNGNYYVSYLCYAALYLIKSANGINWSSPIQIFTSVGQLDKPFLWTDNWSNSTNNGNLYCAWAKTDYNQIEFSYSNDHGNNWQGPFQVNNNGDGYDNGAVIQTDKNGWIYVAYAEGPDGFNKATWAKINIYVSMDGGTTWSQIYSISGSAFGAADRTYTGLGPSMTIDLKSNPNDIYLFWSSKRNLPGENYKIYYVKGNYNNGFNFNDPAIASPSTSYNYIYPWVSCDPYSTGKIACIYRMVNEDPSMRCPSGCPAATGISVSCNSGTDWFSPYQENPIATVQTSPPDDYIGINFSNNIGIGVWNEGTERTSFTSYSFSFETNPLYPTSPLIISGGQTVLIPDSSHLVFNTPGTYLKIDTEGTSGPTNTILLGKGSTIEFYNGTYLSASNCVFKSLDPGLTWDGIYLTSRNSHDTLKNCTFINSVNGINIVGKTNPLGSQPTTEITGCSFIDSTTNAQLTNGIYICNSSNVLVRNCNFSSAHVAEGFINGIMMNYCPSGNNDIIDNTINNVNGGMSIIQSSPYIARNVINGQTGDGIGIYLENANGTLKYNTVNNFTSSLKGYYSSPYLLKNHFNTSSVKGIDLYQNSVPVMNPLNTGCYLRWIAGNNFINGQPSCCGISLDQTSFLAIDSGFNNLTLNGSNYLYCSDMATQILSARYNYWQDCPPNPAKFAVNNGTVIDTPYYNGSTLPPTNSFDLNSIGFGLFDTVYTEDLGCYNLGGGLYSMAYLNEMTGQYVTAILLYKQFVSNFPKNTLAPAAISRIINCLEKKFGTINEFAQLQTYMSQVLLNNNLPRPIRELGEDFIIKSMVRQKIIQNSINNYDSMYQHNGNNGKGVHALINKYSLLAMYPDSQQMHFNLFNNYAKNKLNILSAILGKNFEPLVVTKNNDLPAEFKLYQNYPNPFNPITRIRYDIPKATNVTIKIYDILGKEVYSMNEYKQPGTYELTFDGSNHASGVYFYKIEAGKFTNVKKMVLIR